MLPASYLLLPTWLLMSLSNLKVAIVCDWLTDMGGAERVILALHRLFPDAPIYTSIFNSKNLKEFKDLEVIPSFLNKMPFARKHHRWFLKLMPYAFEQFDLSDYDLVISSSHSCAKGIITKPETLHISYCHTPMRYVWDDYLAYIKQYRLNKVAFKLVLNMLHDIRMWDRLAADRVDHFVANSKFVKKRIKKYYRRNADVIYPPVDVSKFKISNKSGNYFLAIGRLIPYKRFDLLVSTFNRLKLPLKIVGTGREYKSLKKEARSNIEFSGYVSEKRRNSLLMNCKALIFPQCEDFGITPLEAAACGKPVIAYSSGGALETVNSETGVFFDEQTVFSLSKVVRSFDSRKFDPKKIRKWAEKFSVEVFEERMIDYLNKKWGEWVR